METLNLIEENKQLRKALAFCMNRPLIKKLSEAMQRIDAGEFVSEKEFFKNSPQPVA
tara:strand:+ start:2936 stop:3106 length:171 start_codon:yes stop_codon:yes gene_type:complete